MTASLVREFEETCQQALARAEPQWKLEIRRYPTPVGSAPPEVYAVAPSGRARLIGRVPEDLTRYEADSAVARANGEPIPEHVTAGMNHATGGGYRTSTSYILGADWATR